MVKDYHFEMLYHPGKENVFTEALSCKSAGSSTPASCMRITVDSPLVSLIRDAQVEGMRLEKWKLKRIKGESTRLVQDSHKLLTRYGRV